jgi:hypothetical protein
MKWMKISGGKHGTFDARHTHKHTEINKYKYQQSNTSHQKFGEKPIPKIMCILNTDTTDSSRCLMWLAYNWDMCNG